ncbi:unnamed protein product [Camellia sinensis]
MDRLRCSLSRTTITPSLSLLLFLCNIPNLASAAAGFNNLSTITFSEGYNPLFSDFNILRSSDDRTVSLLLNRLSGSGFISPDYYNYGLFSAKIKLRSNYSAGITSNGDVFEKTHDELDLEFLPKSSIVTPFSGPPNPSLFYIDEVPIREVVRNDDMGSDYPSKPMSLYATIWATSGGKYKVNYAYQPFISSYKDLVLQSCVVDPIQQIPSSASCDDKTAALETAEFATITLEGRKAMSWFRERYMYYSYCYDNVRYPVPLLECVIVHSEWHLFKNTGRLKQALKMKFSRHQNYHRRSSRQKSRVPAAAASGATAIM